MILVRSKWILAWLALLALAGCSSQTSHRFSWLRPRPSHVAADKVATADRASELNPSTVLSQSLPNGPARLPPAIELPEQQYEQMTLPSAGTEPVNASPGDVVIFAEHVANTATPAR
ncbi:MAG: hypothetical protein IT423_24000 [Pirellulaceae bacterium]|nr:hypothetical protein [Pirellulaceae bacterium]